MGKNIFRIFNLLNALPASFFVFTVFFLLSDHLLDTIGKGVRHDDMHDDDYRDENDIIVGSDDRDDSHLCSFSI
jgi:hypothetical protein